MLKIMFTYNMLPLKLGFTSLFKLSRIGFINLFSEISQGGKGFLNTCMKNVMEEIDDVL